MFREEISQRKKRVARVWLDDWDNSCYPGRGGIMAVQRARDPIFSLSGRALHNVGFCVARSSQAAPEGMDEPRDSARVFCKQNYSYNSFLPYLDSDESDRAAFKEGCA